MTLRSRKCHRILLTFAGFHDPYTPGLVGDDEQPGPILSLVGARSFGQVILFSTPHTKEITLATRSALKSLYPELPVGVRDVSLADPTDYIAILKGLRFHTREILETSGDTEYFVAVASGTPQMHACWVLLVASGEIPGNLLNIRPSRFVTADMPLVTEINLTHPEFPVVRSNVFAFGVEIAPVTDIQTVLAELRLVGEHPAMLKVLKRSSAIGPSDTSVLILGETGSGKELFARLIHRLSPRANKPFVPINCAALPEELVESLLFGHKKGSFSGAISDISGKFDHADGGTLFLDELIELPLRTQAKLLRVLQDGLVEPIGAKEPHKVDVRLIAATNQDVKTAITEKRFRDDLYFRINVVEIRLPPLRERKSDIPKIALHLLDELNRRNPDKRRRFSPHALSFLQQHHWPGNVRDLRNAIQSAMLLSPKIVLEPEDFEVPVSAMETTQPVLPDLYEGFSIEQHLNIVREQLMSHALELSGGNQSKAAKLLGVSPQAINKFLKKKNSV